MSREARKHDERGMTWYDHQKAYQARVSDTALTLTADAEAVEFSTRQRRILKLGDMVFELFERQRPAIEAKIDEGKMPISVRDMVTVAGLMREVLGPGRDTDKKPGMPSLVQFFGGLNGSPEILAQLEHVIRSDQSDAGGTRGPAEADSSVTGEG